MEINAVSARSSAIQAYTVQQQTRRQNEDSEAVTRREAEQAQPANPAVDQVTLSRESRDLAVRQADQTQRQDETQRSGEARAQDREREDQARLRTANSPRSITQALENYQSTSLV